MKKILAITLFFICVGCSNKSNPVSSNNTFNYSVKQGKLMNMPDSSCYSNLRVEVPGQTSFTWFIKLNYSMEGPVYCRDFFGECLREWIHLKWAGQYQKNILGIQIV